METLRSTLLLGLRGKYETLLSTLLLGLRGKYGTLLSTLLLGLRGKATPDTEDATIYTFHYFKGP